MSNALKSPHIAAAHGFFDRTGGVSTGIYASLNCGPGSGDAPANIMENRARVASALSGGASTPVLSCYQVHGDTVVTATQDWGTDRPRADAVVTATPGLILGILTADCTPVLFEDADAGVIGAAHAGWQGALRGVTDATLAAMEALGARRHRIVAAIGPTIHQPSYEVGADFRDRFTGADADSDRFFAPGRDEEHVQFDLPAYVAARLAAAGVANVWNAGIDTNPSETYFSYRRTTHRQEPDYGRQISAIMRP
jgi:YfiH family protein